MRQLPVLQNLPQVILHAQQSRWQQLFTAVITVNTIVWELSCEQTLLNFKGKRVSFLTSPWIQNLFKSPITSLTLKRARCVRAIYSIYLGITSSYSPNCAQRRRWGSCGLVGGRNGHAKSCALSSVPPSGKTQKPMQHTVGARCLGLCGTCRLYLSCPYGEGVALELFCPLMGPCVFGQWSLRQWFGDNTAYFAVVTQEYQKRKDARDVGLTWAQRLTIHLNPSNKGLGLF